MSFKKKSIFSSGSYLEGGGGGGGGGTGGW